MGILGSPEFYKLTSTLNVTSFKILDVCGDCLYHGVDWLYTNVSVLSIYDFKIWYFLENNFIFDESFDFLFSFCWVFSLIESSYQFFFAVLLDIYIQSTLIKLPYLDDWYRSFFNCKENTLFFIFHPEFIFFKNFSFLYFFNNFSTLRFSIFNSSINESFDSNIILFFEFLFIVFFSVIFIVFYFSFFTNPYKEENFIDVDYLSCSASLEAEKEISSFDDMILIFIVLFYIFGWYFYIHCWSMLSLMPELVLVFYLFPGLYFIIIGIPTFLIWDFGIFFLIYLRGVGSTTLLMVELVYDYLAVIIFYTRILVQGVRLILMLFTYASMHDVVLFFSFSQKMFLGSEFLWENFNSMSITLDTFSYFFFFSLPGIFLYWIYEIFHTFFVVTIQFAAFFAIVFWLFLFLYTFFVLEKQENYFSLKRLQRKNYYNYIYNLK
jgi:hypothetical protein